MRFLSKSQRFLFHPVGFRQEGQHKNRWYAGPLTSERVFFCMGHLNNHMAKNMLMLNDILVNLLRIRVKPTEREGVFLLTKLPAKSFTESSCKDNPVLKIRVSAASLSEYWTA